ncbi:hypothetical protein [Maribacter arcticus]|uniref:hypothetical protein n=1 Tax=Maribacter arcticus TaxID=561365 RepID=UPI003002019E
MPNKSDSAGKLHQYYTYKYLKSKSSTTTGNSPLDDTVILSAHTSLFTANELKSLKIIGQLSADEISAFVIYPIALVQDIGVSSGAVGFINTDDLVVNTGYSKFSFSLKCATSIDTILSKNMGAQSLLKKYFHAPTEQANFNNYFENRRMDFLNSILSTSHTTLSGATTEINSFAKSNGLDKARFNHPIFSHANTSRNLFLTSIRDCLYHLINSLNKDKIANACNIILDSEKNHIHAEYKSGKEKITFLSIPLQVGKDVLRITKTGDNTVNIKIGDYTVGFRFKFESGITQSIKLVGSYRKI